MGLKDIYMAFCLFGDRNNKGTMNGRQFQKFCRDNGLISGPNAQTDCDIFFKKIIPKGKRVMLYSHFRQACEILAKGIYGDIPKALERFSRKCRGPTATGTVAENVKWHDDKSTYTGVYKQGGPTIVDNVITLRSLADRSKANARGVKLTDHKAEGDKKGRNVVTNEVRLSRERKSLTDRSGVKLGARKKSPKPVGRRSSKSPAQNAAIGLTLKTVFMKFCKFGDPTNTGKMTGAKYFKFTKDCGIVDKKLTRTSVDLLFSKIKVKGQRTINFATFKKSMMDLAKLKFGSTDEIERILELALGGKTKSSGTKADKVKFHDDKSLYTGVYKKGGPTMVDNRITLNSLADRSSHDARGVKYTDKQW
ncbi:hypothetical protein AAMO2058_001338400 [Amorphochlora amoebiformis]